ncbi:TRAP transporter substrate-binding protein DctP [Roseospira visakhapatnamensis]|uniref:C4-dicarboxylate-binding protein DctP n=1 Tax=Roseospira visakhapatnamensis TaxID=390880 RepID=A0A7W6RC26_9PROT|nr:TRAP transporter substrate-binding protein DctP [Roseospira visakhapatnamensis]MBB4265665.1 C4-dicarboxylate-binding protein DctP [Roseospira visakhapatnamensis]
MTRTVFDAFAQATAVAALVALVATASPSARAAEVEMIMTNEIATTHWTAEIMEEYADLIETRSLGRIDVQIYHAGSLFKDKEAVAALGTGAVHMVWPVSVQLESVAPAYGVVNLPFSITDEVMLKEGAPQELAGMLSDFVADRGLRVMGLMRTADLIFLFPDSFVETTADLEGQKIRLTGGKVLQALMREYGASPITMPATEMAAALMQGAIDGIFTSYGGWRMVGVSASKKATLVPGLSLLTYTVVADDAWLKDLPDDLRAVIEDTTAEMLATQWMRGIEGDKRERERMLGQGGALHVVEGDAHAAFREGARRASQIFIDRHPEVWEAFQAFMRKHEG